MEREGGNGRDFAVRERASGSERARDMRRGIGFERLSGDGRIGRLHRQRLNRERGS